MVDIDPATLAEWQNEARAAGERMRKAIEALDLDAALAPIAHLRIDVNRDFVERLRRGDHLNSDFLRGC